MQLRATVLPSILSAIVAATAGWYTHTSHPVHAAENLPASMQFQLQGAGPDAQLSIYDGQSQTLYVYQGINTGSDVKACSYQLRIPRAGGPLRRTNCAVSTYPGN